MHGLSNCPAQFTKLGRLLFERGHNVIIPRIPYHGEQNRLATDWARLTAGDMLDAGNQAVDLARSLGDRITAGLSINGASCLDGSEPERSDRAFFSLLFLAPAGLPDWTLTPVERLLLRLPNMFFWWDAKLKENLQGPPFAYPRFPTRVIGETMLLGREVLRESRSQSPRSALILVVTSASDTAANNRVTSELVANWRCLRQDGIETFEFPAADEVPHDFIDPNQPNQKRHLSTRKSSSCSKIAAACIRLNHGEPQRAGDCLGANASALAGCSCPGRLSLGSPDHRAHSPFT
jgi:hypothetical protein